MRTYVLTAKERSLTQLYSNGVDLSRLEMAKVRVFVQRFKLSKKHLTEDMKLGAAVLTKYYEENGDDL